MILLQLFRFGQIGVRFLIRLAYTLCIHLILMLLAFVANLLLDFVGFCGRNAFDIGFWEYFLVAFYFPIPFVGVALWVCWLFNLMPKHVSNDLFWYPWWARKVVQTK
tara:strand:- start:156 stop:476 length:321 start_codon:yes stop_codon:yes gene_type:complete